MELITRVLVGGGGCQARGAFATHTRASGAPWPAGRIAVRTARVARRRARV
jgi:hypothetical protein